MELLQWWTREGRDKRLFFAQLEAAKTIILLTEARANLLQGITVPRDEPSEERRHEGFKGFLRYACKMATGSGKTTVMGMLAAWSILNKVNAKNDARFSDVVLAVCPNVTIRHRLGELDAERGEASIYRTRDLVPPHLMPLLTRGKVLVTNWHVFEPQQMQTGGVSARVNKAGIEVRTKETITIGPKSTTARGTRYLSLEDLDRQVAAGPDTSEGEAPEVSRYEANRAPGSTADVDYWTSRDVREVLKSHLNFVVAHTTKWEQSAAYFIDTHPAVEAFVKNEGLGFAIPYFNNGQDHDYMPDFIIRLKDRTKTHLILETKGYDPLEEAKVAAAKRWVAAVNAEGTYGRWAFCLAKKPTEVVGLISTTIK